MLASDLNNPEFMGAVGPDSVLYAEIHMYEPIDQWKTIEESRKAQRFVLKKGEPTPYIRIRNPGDSTWEEHRPLHESDKRRFPHHYMRFQIDQGEMAAGEIPGWKLEDWPELDADLLRDLKYQRFQTVEQLAGASDKQLQGIGMGGVALKQKAMIAIRARNTAESQAEIAKRDAEIAALQKETAEMRALVEKVLAGQAQPREVITARK